MQQILEWVGVLIIMLAVLRVSRWRRGRSFGLRGGLTGLNVITGLLAGLIAGLMLRDGVTPASPIPDADGLALLAAALRNLLPFAGAAAGGLVAYLVLGTAWRSLFRGGSARARGWLLRAEFAACAVALVLLVLRAVA